MLALLISAPWWPSIVRAATAKAVATITADEFMALSRFATAGATLDPKIGAALLAALRESDDSISATLRDLAAQAASGRHADVEALEAALRDTPLHATLLTVVSAWYTGAVIVKGTTRVITLEDALMYAPIADGSHIPGVCAGATNSWAELKAPALAAMPPR